MKYWFIFLILLVPSSAFGGIEDIYYSVCRITDDRMIGTAFCYKEDKNKYYCLTAGHCHHTGKVLVDLFHDGYILRVNGNFIDYKNISFTTTDYGIITIDKTEIKDYSLLKPLKLASKIPTKGIIWTLGCSDGSWPSLYKGRILNEKDMRPMPYIDKLSYSIELVKLTKDMVFFSPPPNQGRSGSPLLNDKYEVIGMILMSGGTGNGGIAVSVDTLKKEIND